MKHPGIPRLTDSFAHKLDFYLIFEGKSFHSLKEECDYREANSGSRALEPDEIQGLFFQLLDILDFAHSKGITHSKLEPDNILWYADDDGRIKLIDFKAMDDVDDDPETDMLAFGTTIFYLATGTAITEVQHVRAHWTHACQQWCSHHRNHDPIIWLALEPGMELLRARVAVP